MSRRLLAVLGAVAVVAVVVIGLSQTGTKNAAPKPTGFDLAQAKHRLAGAPAPLAELHRQSNTLLKGSASDVKARIASLKGHPVVINKWASWCGPCRYEFPFLQRAATRYGKQVAFLALDTGDNRTDATTFLSKFPVPYPSYEDRNNRIAGSLQAGVAFPTTIYYDAQGKRRYVHQGLYSTEDKLVADIERYALGHPA